MWVSERWSVGGFLARILIASWYEWMSVGAGDGVASDGVGGCSGGGVDGVDEMVLMMDL